MKTEKLLMVSIIIFAIFAGILGIVNAIAFASATDDTCTSISKAWAETMMVLNIVMIFFAVVVIAFVTYELFKGSGREDVLKSTKEKEAPVAPVQAPKQYQPPTQPTKQYQPPTTYARRLPPSRVEDASSIADRPLAISRELTVANAYEL